MSECDSQLLCTFSSLKSYEGEVFELAKFYTIDENRIYVLANVSNTTEFFLTFNVSKVLDKFYPRTILVHRKRDYNVLYSINALNELVKLENNGNVSSDCNITWSQYQNTLITTKDGNLKITPTKLVKIVRL